MTLDAWYWLFVVAWIIFGVWRDYPNPNWRAWGGGMLMQIILFVLIGMRIFGSPIK